MVLFTVQQLPLEQKVGTGNTGTGTSTGKNNGKTGAATGNTGSTTLTVDQMPKHRHLIYAIANPNSGGIGIRGTFNGNEGAKQSAYSTGISTGDAGEGKGHTHTLNSHTHTLNNHQHTIPYIECYVWKRTA